MSDPEVTDGVVDDGAGIPVTVQGAAPESTGDDAVDAALRQLDGATDEPLDVQIEVAERVHRVLQGRLADLGQE